jgi:hypothetical protein
MHEGNQRLLVGLKHALDPRDVYCSTLNSRMFFYVSSVEAFKSKLGAF